MTKAFHRTIQANFDQHWRLNEATGCWEWTAGKCKGYGVLKVNGKNTTAYRHSYERANGPIPPGLHALHRCDNKACVNPSHLYLGTHQDNMADTRGKHPKRSRPRHAKLTSEQAAQIRSMKTSGRKQTEIGEVFGVSGSTVSLIWRDRTWRHV